MSKNQKCFECGSKEYLWTSGDGFYICGSCQNYWLTKLNEDVKNLNVVIDDLTFKYNELAKQVLPKASEVVDLLNGVDPDKQEEELKN